MILDPDEIISTRDDHDRVYAWRVDPHGQLIMVSAPLDGASLPERETIDRLLTHDEAARMLATYGSHLSNWAKSGGAPPSFLLNGNKRQRRYRLSAVTQWIAQQEREHASE